MSGRGDDRDASYNFGIYKSEGIPPIAPSEIAVAKARIQELVTAIDALVDFHNGPLEAKRPDVFHRLLSRAAAASDKAKA